MGCKELIESLREAASEKANAIWADVYAQGERARTECAGRIERIKTDAAQDALARADRIRGQALGEARIRARQQLLVAEKELADRLFTAARSRLGQLREHDYDAAFKAMAQELPQFVWERVNVNPSDVERAKVLFPDTAVVADSDISGGLEVMGKNGQVTVINTFEKRLERAWEDMLPELIREVANGTAP